METSSISPARLSLINKLEQSRKWYSLTFYTQNFYRFHIGPITVGCLAGLSPGATMFGVRDGDMSGWNAGATFLELRPGGWRTLFFPTRSWPHAYQTLYAHDRVEAGIQAILAVNEYGDFPYPSREPVKLPDIMKSLADQIDQIQHTTIGETYVRTV